MNTTYTSNKNERMGKQDNGTTRNVQVHNTFFQRLGDFLVQFAIGAGGIALVYILLVK